MSLDEIKEIDSADSSNNTDNPLSAFEEVNYTKTTQKQHKFTKRTRNLIYTSVGAVILAAVLLVVTLLPQNSSDGSDTTSAPIEDTTITLLDKSSKNEETVQRVDIKNADEQYALVYSKDAKRLVIENYEDITVDEELSNTLLAYTTVITAFDKLEKPGDFSEYGLDKATSTATITYTDNSQATIIVGNETPAKDGYYATISGDDQVYIMESDSVSLFSVRAAAFADTTLMATPTVKNDDANGVAVLKSIKYSGSNHAVPFSIRRSYYTDSEEMTLFSYIISQPYVRGTSDAVSTQLGNFKSLAATQALYLHPTAQQKSQLGFDNPLIVMDMTMAVETAEDSESSTSLDEAAEKKIYYNSYSTKLTIGSLDKNGNYIVTIDGLNAIYLVEKTALSSLAERTYTNSVNELLFLKNISDVGKVSITIDGQQHDFTLEHHPEIEENDKNMVVNCNGKQYPTGDFRELYQQLMGLERYGTTQSDYDPKATLKVNIYAVDGSLYLGATYYPLSGTLCAVETTEGEIFTTRWKNVTHFVEQIQNYLNGDKVLILT